MLDLHTFHSLISMSDKKYKRLKYNAIFYYLRLHIVGLFFGFTTPVYWKCIIEGPGSVNFFFCYKICIVNGVYSKKGCFIDIFIIELNFRIFFGGAKMRVGFTQIVFCFFLEVPSKINHFIYLL